MELLWMEWRLLRRERSSLTCLNDAEQQEQNLTNTLKLFHESCMVSDKKSLCAPNLKILAVL